MRLLPSLFLSSILAFHLPAVPAAVPRPAVGVVLSSGSFQVAHTAVTGTATVLAGDEVESVAYTSRVMLQNGSEVALAPHSSGSFYQDHATLLDGSVRVKSSAPFFVTARNFTVTASGAGSVAVLETNGPALTVHVASGGATVISSAGATLAHMTAGSTLAFDSLAGAAGAGAAADTNVSNTTVRLLGVLTQENGHYLVRDRYTNNVFEVASDQVNAKMVDHLVMVDGTWVGNSKSSVAQVDHYVQASKIAASDATTAVPCRPDGAGGVLTSIVLNGVLSKVRNHFLVKDASKGTYEVVGDVQDKEVGTDLHEKGFILPQHPTVQPAEKVVYLERRKLTAFGSPCVGSMVGGTIITTGVLLARGTGDAVAPLVKPISY